MAYNMQEGYYTVGDYTEQPGYYAVGQAPAESGGIGAWLRAPLFGMRIGDYAITPVRLAIVAAVVAAGYYGVRYLRRKRSLAGLGDFEEDIRNARRMLETERSATDEVLTKLENAWETAKDELREDLKLDTDFVDEVIDDNWDSIKDRAADDDEIVEGIKENLKEDDRFIDEVLDEHKDSLLDDDDFVESVFDRHEDKVLDIGRDKLADDPDFVNDVIASNPAVVMSNPAVRKAAIDTLRPRMADCVEKAFVFDESF